MGVMPCNRSNCGNVMCDTYVGGAGYVCYECREEFKNWLNSQMWSPADTQEMKEALKQFLETEKGQTFNPHSGMDVDKFFEEHTRQ